jgi:hypothetical protein
MTGAILQLVAKGVQDRYLTDDPSITFFKATYRRHVNFASESIPFNFKSEMDFGSQKSITIPKKGDLCSSLTLEIQLPAIPQMKHNGFAWVKYLGHVLVEEYQLFIGETQIDSRYGEWLHLWSEVNAIDQPGLHRLIGHRPELYQPSDSKDSATIYIPLDLFFSKNYSVSLPLVALREQVSLNIKLRNLNECCYYTCTHSTIWTDEIIVPEKEMKRGNITIYPDSYDYMTKRLYYRRDGEITENGGDLFSLFNATGEIWQEENEKPGWHNSLSINSAVMYGNFIFLEADERHKYFSQSLEYLIDIVEKVPEGIFNGSLASVKINSKHPCTSMIWIGQMSSISPDNPFDYSNGKSGPVILESSLNLDGIVRISWSPESYFRLVQPLQYYRRKPPIGTNYYSFELYPFQTQKSGSLNLSTIENLEFFHKLGQETKGPKKIRTYLTKLNRLIIFSGQAGLGFD